MKKCVLGLSGGVDSAAAASILKSDGFTVTGVYLDGGFGEDAAARAAADALGIDFLTISIKNELNECVIRPFAAEYLRGRTPNPCVTCNPLVKFAALFKAADALGAEYVATGHYARTAQDSDGRFGLYRALSPNDQSYMLYRLSADLLPRLKFPLGSLSSKSEVREFARSIQLPSADSPDSMDICFVPDGDYPAFVEKFTKETPPPGDFTDSDGNILGRHLGIHHYTVGQRKGLGISSSGRLFVKEIDPSQNRVILSDLDVYKNAITLSDTVFLMPELSETDSFDADVKVRHSRASWKARVFPGEDGHARIEFDPPARAPSPGQSAVFYIEDRVAGGGIID